MLIIGYALAGNVQIDSSHLGLLFDVTVPPSDCSSHVRSQSLAAFRRWAQASNSVNSASETSVTGSRRTPSILQLSHPGRQSMRGAGRAPWRRALCPSATPLAPGGKSWINTAIFGTPKEMEIDDFDRVVCQFREGARIARETGWDGVQLHNAHGYLLAQALSPNVSSATLRLP